MWLVLKDQVTSIPTSCFQISTIATSSTLGEVEVTRV
jgi:hypothetical protein